MKTLCLWLCCLASASAQVVGNAVLGNCTLGVAVADGGEPTGTALITTVSVGTLDNSFTGEVGWKYLRQGGDPAVTVTALGLWMHPGMSGTHKLLIRTDDGSIVASNNIAMSGLSSNQFHYVSITPLALSAFTYYFFLVSESNGGDYWAHSYNTTATCTAGAINDSAYFDGTFHEQGTGSTKIYGPVGALY